MSKLGVKFQMTTSKNESKTHRVFVAQNNHHRTVSV